MSNGITPPPTTDAINSIAQALHLPVQAANVYQGGYHAHQHWQWGQPLGGMHVTVYHNKSPSDFRQLASCYQQASDQGLAPQLRQVNQDQRWLAVELGQPLEPAALTRPETHAQIATCLAQLHRTTCKHLRPAEGLQQRCLSYLAEPSIKRLLAACDVQTKDISDLLARLPQVASTWIHGDLHVHNVVKTQQGLRLIDWEMSGLGHPMEDIAHWCQYLAPNHAQAFCQAYEAAQRRQTHTAALRLLKAHLLKRSELCRAYDTQHAGLMGQPKVHWEGLAEPLPYLHLWARAQELHCALWALHQALALSTSQASLERELQQPKTLALHTYRRQFLEQRFDWCAGELAALAWACLWLPY